MKSYFKQTQLGELVRIATGGTPSRNDPEGWVGGQIPWVTTSEVSFGRLAKTRESITDHGLANSSATIVPRGSVLVAMIGQGRTRGQVALLEMDASTNQNCASLVPGDRVDSEYLFQTLAFSYNALRGLSNASGQGNLNARLIASLPIPEPPLREQRKIAEILRAWDDAIDAAEREATMRRRLARDSLNRLISSAEHGAEHRRLWEVSEPVRRRSDGADHPVMTISAQRGFVRQSEKFRRDMAGDSLRTYTLLRRGEFAYNKGNSATFPQGCVFALGQNSALVPSVYVSFALDSSLNGRFYQHYFSSGALNRQLAQRISSSVRGNGLLNITPKAFMSVEVPVPDRAQQDLIALAADHRQQELTLLQRRTELLREQKRGLMQKLLSGEIRVGESGGGAS